jgi:hypothetical protein
MKAKYINIYIALIMGAVLVFPACEPEVVTTLKLPQEEPRLVLTAILESGNAVHSVFLTRSASYSQYTVTGNEVVNGVITISDGNDTISLTHFDGAEYRFYNSNLPVISGKTYTITAEAPGFAKKVYGSCTIPDDFQPEAELVTITQHTGMYENSWRIALRFRSVVQGEAFYRISGRATFIPYLNGVAESPLELGIYGTGKYKELIHADGGTNQWYDLTYQMWDHFSMYDYDSIVPTDAELLIYRTDESYYKFHYPFVVNGYWGNDGNPFAEPTIIYSNITNGYGVMAGTIMKTIKLPLQ